jgi:hypothetical protein
MPVAILTPLVSGSAVVLRSAGRLAMGSGHGMEASTVGEWMDELARLG